MRVRHGRSFGAEAHRFSLISSQIVDFRMGRLRRKIATTEIRLQAAGEDDVYRASDYG